jgi:hypothetical protein
MADPSQHVLCPYCGHVQKPRARCGDCGGLFDEYSRMATQIAMGPWQIRSRSKPFHPGCSYEVLKKLIASGKVTERTIVRGPTTNQFWQIARRVPGVAHRLGYCHACNGRVKRNSVNCEHCGETFTAPSQRNELGLQYADERAVAAARAKLDEHHKTAASPGKPAASSADLLDEVLGDAPVRVASSTPASVPQPGETVTVTGGDDQGGDTIDQTPAPSRSKWLVPALIALNVIAMAVVLLFIFAR